MTRDQMLAYLRTADAVAREAAAYGHHPFGAVLVGPDDRIRSSSRGPGGFAPGSPFGYRGLSLKRPS
jgi:tRNA(Arg) A34 adenosine deaminase TadA